MKISGTEVDVPTPGRIVYYYTELDRNPRPAMVLLANSNGFADLAVFTGHQSIPVQTALSVGYHGNGTAHSWRWPPREGGP